MCNVYAELEQQLAAEGMANEEIQQAGLSQSRLLLFRDVIKRVDEIFAAGEPDTA